MFKVLKNTLKIKKPRKAFRKIRLGICAMDKKAQSKPMREILSRLPSEIFEIITFGDDRILNEPIEEWPVVEALIAFYSTRFPTEKVMAYVKLRKPFLLNDLEVDNNLLKDRRKVYKMLQSQGIEVPKHVILNRDGSDAKNSVEEFDEYIVVNGVQINKPLVEKPVNAEDHNIYIYYPMSAGGGSKRLFRKVNDRSSEFYPHINELRTEGSFIYEEFITTQGTDVKVYTVGPNYAHAEARKSPVVDGRVKRDQDGLEIRYPVILSPKEKMMARKIVLTSKQTVCGFDILRAQGHSYCCDVNGFSFVKNSRKYYDDASQLMADMILRAVRSDYFTPHGRMSSDLARLMTLSWQVRSNALPATAENGGAGGATEKSGDNIGHGARMSSSISAPIIMGTMDELSMSRDHGSSKLTQSSSTNTSVNNDSSGSSAVSAATTATAADSAGQQQQQPPPSPSRSDADADAPGAAAAAAAETGSADSAVVSTCDVDTSMHSDVSSYAASGVRSRLHVPNEELRCVIAIMRHGDRTPKQKLKIKIREARYLDYFHSYAKHPRQDLKVKSRSGLIDFLTVTKGIIEEKTASGADPELTRQLVQMKNVLESHEISGINRKLQMKPERWADDVDGGGGGGGDKAAAAKGEAAQPASEKSKGAAKEGRPKDRCKSTAALATEVLLILKWGGDLTPLGREQAEQLGEQFRHSNYPDTEGGGVLRLHATYRHDLKIKASDEGRVMKTAAAFAKGLLELEGQLTPILASLVTVEEKNSQMLDRGDNIEVKADMDQCKKRLDHIQVDAQMSEELIEKVAPECSATMRQMLYSLNNPLQCLKRMHELMKGIVAQLKDISEKGQAIQQQQILVKKQLQQRMNAADADASANVSLAQLTMSEEDTPPSVPSTPFQPHRRFLGTGLDSDQLETSVGELYLNEQFDLMYDRWKQIYGDFLSKKTGMFDLTKVPDVYDMVRYDVLHNIHLKLEGIEELYQLSKAFDSCVVPQEYGSDRLEKRYIGCKMCCALLEKIRKDIHVAMTNADDENAMLYRLDHTHAEDLQINSVHRAVRTRLYFTSESHMHTLLNVLHYPSDGQPPLLSEEGLQAIDDIPAVSYLSQIVLRVFEQTPTSYRCELSFSPGAIADPFSGEKTTVAPCGLLDSNVKVGQLIDHLEDAINLSRAGRKGSSAEVSTPGATPSINDDF